MAAARCRRSPACSAAATAWRARSPRGAGRGAGSPGVTQWRVEINGQPGALLFDAEGKVFGALALEIRDGRVQSVRAVVNPDKLRHLGDVADMRAVLKTGDH
jgi:RNA polymerase sigma-70 factor (ECF subfamily)